MTALQIRRPGNGGPEESHRAPAANDPKRHRSGRAVRRALTLIDVVALLCAIGIALALALPAMVGHRESARRDDCARRLRDLGVAFAAFHDRTTHFPSAGDVPRQGKPSNELSWHVSLLGDLGYQYLLDDFNLAIGPYHSPSINYKNNPHGLVRVTEYVCPSATSDRSVGFQDAVLNNAVYTTHYYGVMGPLGFSPSGKEYKASEYGPFATEGVLVVDDVRRLTDITDGASSTYLVGELSWDNAGSYRSWVRGSNGDAVAGAKNVKEPIRMAYFGDGDLADGSAGGFNDVSLGSEHPGGTHLLYADGSVRFCEDMIDVVVYKSSASISGND